MRMELYHQHAVDRLPLAKDTKNPQRNQNWFKMARTCGLLVRGEIFAACLLD
jgi:hypothetical protein